MRHCSYLKNNPMKEYDIKFEPKRMITTENYKIYDYVKSK